MTDPEKLRLLIVEDDIVDRKLLVRSLAQSSLGPHEVDYAGRLSTALEMLRTHSFDMVLLDLGLPDSRGTESVIELQMHAPHVPIIVLSGLDDEKTATTAVQKGVQDYLIKGQVDSTLLVRSIRYALERKKAERQLQVAEQRYRMIFQNSAVAIMMVDEEGRMVSWNQFTEQLLGMTREELLGRSVRSLYSESQWERIRALNIRRKGMQHHLETQMIRQGGDVIDVDISLSVLKDTDGTVTGSIGVVRDITESKRMERALRHSEKRFRQVVENAKEWIWEIDADGLYTYSSPIVEKILGYKPKEILGKKHFYDFFHPDDAPQLKAQAFEFLHRNDVFSDFQTRNLHKDGKVVWLTRSGVPVFNDNQELIGYRGADVDITERMRTHKILDRKQKNLEAIFDAAPVGMLLVNDNMIVQRANETIRHMSGKDYHDIIDQSPCTALGCNHSDSSDDVGRCDECSLKTMIQVVLESGKSIRGLEIRPVVSDNGEAVRPWLLVSVEPLSIDSGRHVVVALDDITDRKHAEEELRDTMEMKSQFVSTISHELRTPLTSIREAVNIMLDEVAGRINKYQRNFLYIAKRNIDRLSRLINDVLDFQKLNAGKMRFDLEENSIEATVEDAFNTMRPYARKRGVHLRLDCQPDLPKIAFDADRIVQALTNLLSNSIKFTPEDGHISISVQRRGEYLAIQVSDTGYGIPKDSLPKIFERFYRVRRPGKEIKGTGLGLAIVNKIVTGHGGRIDVESELNKGTTFTVLLPLGRKPPANDLPEQADEHLEATLTDH
ncbi:MAG: PAS domain S-box protein [Phycisphaerales bacterium]|nr:MAG: PAS domain S-box protein [Phycisphaerales bacterium]